MRLVIILTVICVLFAQPPVGAQQAGENVNVLPIVLPQDDADWMIKGDGYLQRQVEPTVAASTRNPDHLIAFFNDYRAVDQQDDIGLGETENMVVLVNTTRTFMTAAALLPLPKLPELHLPPTAAAEAWVGMSRSYDGGLTWSGAFLPGAPFDLSTASVNSPVHGLEAATDPVLAAGPCGKFYVVFMAFTRGDESKLVVARYQDLNNIEGGDSIVYQGMTVVESGNNATHGYFLDKPDIEVDIFREPNADICADRVYVSYSTFNGLDNDGKFQSKISFARSFDGGLTYDATKLNPPYNQNQGSALAVDPGDGTIYMIWRHFWDPDAILMVKSTNYGKKWTKPVVVTGNLPMAPFDQPSISTTLAPTQIAGDLNPGLPEVAFRSNGFPTAAVTDAGTLFVAWQERVGIDPASTATFGRPLAGGSPRIVVVRSDNGGSTWSDVDGLPGDRRAVDMGDRDVVGSPNLPDPGFGALPQERPSGPQVQPKMTFSAGQLLLAYYESRGRLANWGSGTETIVPDADVSPYTGFISGYDRMIDFRAALLDPVDGTFVSTTQVSRYPIRAGAALDQNDPYSEDLSDVAAVNSPCSPDSGVGYPPCVRQVNRVNAPQSAAGTTPFIGDYPDVAPVVQFVYDQQQGKWRWATAEDDVPYRAFHTIFTDNRHLVPPTEVPAGEDPNQPEWELYKYYSPPGENLLCLNAGSRNTDVLTSKVDAELVLSAPTTYKQLEFQRGFPISIKNQTGDNQSYDISITEGFDAASFVRNNPDIDAGSIELFPYSGTALMVYVETSATPPVKVRVEQTTNCSDDCPSGIITLNLDPANPPVAALVNQTDAQYPEITDPFVINPFVINDGAENPFVINPFVINPFVINPFVINPFVINPFVINPFVINPFVINSSVEDVIDTTWTVTAGDSNTASSYLPLINVDNAQAFINAGYAFQLIVHKGSLYGSFDACNPINVAQPQILANVTQDPHDTVNNPFVINPFVINPFVINPFVINPFVINSTFTMAPSDATVVDDTTKAPPASNDVKVTLRAFKLNTGLKNGVVYNPLEDPPSLVIVPLPCDPDDPVDCDVVSVSPDLQPLNVDATPVTAEAGRTLVGFPAGGWTLFNEGLPDQLLGDAVAENGFLNHGFHICPIDHIDDANGETKAEWAETPLDLAPCSTIQESLPHVLPDVTCTEGDPGNPLECTTLELWDSEPYPAVDLSIPDITPDDYYLVLYVDDTREVSERVEVNNWVKVLITIEEPNDPPTATDESFPTDEDTPLTADFPADDPNLDTLSFTITQGPPEGGSVTDNLDGSFTYNPAENFNGDYSFTFVANDGEFDSDSATVTINVAPVNDPPVVTVADIVVDEDGSAVGVVTATDVDGDPLSYVVSTLPTKGEVSAIDPETGVFTYTPFDNLNGTDTFSVTVGDTTVEVTVTVDVAIAAVADAPVAEDAVVPTDEDIAVSSTLIATDADEGDVLTFVLVTGATNGTAVVDPDGSFTYTPAADFNGTDTFTFKANDGDPTYLDSNTATITITVAADNDAPVAVDADYQVFENTPLAGALVASDVDGDPLTYSVATPPSFGGVTIDPATGAFTYTPNDRYLGGDSFTFTATDTSDATGTGLITINVIDPVPNWNFIGFDTPWRPNYKVNAGSAIPLKWTYTDPDTGAVVDSSMAEPEIRITAYVPCNSTGDPLTWIEDPGSSDLRYFDGDWQFNWDTVDLDAGCYFLSIYHPTTDQLDDVSEDGDPLRIELK